MKLRVGIGLDSHRFRPGRPLVLGGVEIPGADGLDGHSDADLVLHAIVDAILGALALGDIGTLFPDDDPTWKDADSRIFLRRALDLAEERGYAVGNVDVTVVAEVPRLRPHVDRIRRSLAEALGAAMDAVSVKATTAERMGALGRREGMACTAVVTMIGDER